MLFCSSDKESWRGGGWRKEVEEGDEVMGGD